MSIKNLMEFSQFQQSSLIRFIVLLNINENPFTKSHDNIILTSHLSQHFGKTTGFKFILHIDPNLFPSFWNPVIPICSLRTIKFPQCRKSHTSTELKTPKEWLTKAKGSWSRNRSWLNRCRGVKASHQQPIKGNASGNGHWEKEKTEMFKSAFFHKILI